MNTVLVKKFPLWDVEKVKKERKGPVPNDWGSQGEDVVWYTIDELRFWDVVDRILGWIKA